MKRLFQLNTFIVFLFLYLPILVVVIFSFNRGDQITIWEGFSMRWYTSLFKNSDVWRACKNSLMIAGTATILSTIIGTAAALAIEKHRFRFKIPISNTLYLPIIIPDIVLAIALLTFFSQLKIRLNLYTVIIAHVVFNIAYVTIIVRARLQGYDQTIEEAALDLGANHWQTFYRITLPIISPGVIGGALLAFTLSIDDFVITFFTAGIGYTTLSVYIYNSLKFGITPEINAISTMLLFNSIIFIILFLWFRTNNLHNSSERI